MSHKQALYGSLAFVVWISVIGVALDSHFLTWTLPALSLLVCWGAICLDWLWRYF